MARERGTALVEFALTLPFILILMFTIVDLGRAVQRYNGLVKAARDAVRYLSVHQQGTHANEARNLVMYGTLDGSGTLLDPDLTVDMVKAPTWRTEGANPLINTVTVRISGYQFTPIASSVFGVAFPTFTFGDITATMRCPL